MTRLRFAIAIGVDSAGARNYSMLATLPGTSYNSQDHGDTLVILMSIAIPAKRLVGPDAPTGLDPDKADR
jgi:hypothetical protein